MDKDNNGEIDVTESADIVLRKERMAQLEKRLANPNRLTTKEYSELLHEVQKNYMIMLAILSNAGKTGKTGAYMAMVEKTHYLIDSIERKYGNAHKPENLMLSLEALSTDELVALRATLIKLKAKAIENEDSTE